MSQQLAELLQGGVPMVDSLRVLAPASLGLGGSFSRVLFDAADRVEPRSGALRGLG